MSSWNEFFAAIELPASQAKIWAALHTPEVIDSAIAQTAVKYTKLSGRMDLTYMVKFASAVMNRLAREQAANKGPGPTVMVAEKKDAKGNC
jgi:hypothetical protein